MYLVVEFPNERTVEAVPSTWVNEEGTLCHWPEKTGAGGLTNLVKKNCPPQDDWMVYLCRVLGKYGKPDMEKTCFYKKIHFRVFL